MNKPITLTGGCQCDAIRYKIESTRGSVTYFCHCRMCQRAVGNIFATFAKAMKSDLKWLKKEPKYYESSAFVRRGFCPECGTPLTFEYHSGVAMDVTVGSLDDPEQVSPEWRTGVESRCPSYEHKTDLPEHRTDNDLDHVAAWKKEYGADLMPGEFPDEEAQ